MIRRCDERDFELIWAIINSSTIARKLTKELSLQIAGQSRTCLGRNCRMKSIRSRILGLRGDRDADRRNGPSAGPGRDAYSPHLFRTSSQKRGAERTCCLICGNWQMVQRWSAHGLTRSRRSASYEKYGFQVVGGLDLSEHSRKQTSEASPLMGKDGEVDPRRLLPNTPRSKTGARLE